MNIGDAVITFCHDDCGISFAVPEWWYKCKRQTKTWFFCPNGHRQHFTGETDEDRYRRERDIARQQVARAEQEQRAAMDRAVKAEREAKRIKKRAYAALCPCCNRHFSQLERHMKSKHPEIAVLPKKVG